MQPYGHRKGHTHVAGHQECGICHPAQKNLKKRARRKGKVKVVMAKRFETREKFDEAWLRVMEYTQVELGLSDEELDSIFYRSADSSAPTVEEEALTACGDPDWLNYN
jgi:hypothetical protein